MIFTPTFEDGIALESKDISSSHTFYPNPTSGTITFNRMDIKKVEVLYDVGKTVAVYENAYMINKGNF